MLIWLDASTDKESHPNENFARELMELFTLGIGNYTEDDVREAARCFTGWVFDRQTGSFDLRPRQHDDAPKTVLGRTGSLTGEEVIDLVTHSAARARYVPAKPVEPPGLPGDDRATRVVRDLVLGIRGRPRTQPPAPAGHLPASRTSSSDYARPGWSSSRPSTSSVRCGPSGQPA